MFEFFRYKVILGLLIFISTTSVALSLNFCEPNPCLYGARCELAGIDYQCIECHRLTTGNRCQNINCESANCFARNGTLYLVMESPSGWETANRKCSEERMTLVMPKDEESNKFVVDQLTSVYHPKNYRVDFWLGLRKDVSGWRWVDGSALGDYRGGNGTFDVGTSDLYGSLARYYNTFAWKHVPIYSNNYPICQITSIP